jgi:hypothetical protein
MRVARALKTLTTTSASCTAAGVRDESIVLGTVAAGRGNKHGRAAVRTIDNCGAVISGATISEPFSGDVTETNSVETDGSVVAQLITTTLHKGRVSFGFCLDDVSTGSLPCVPESNLQTCDSN